MTILVMNCGSSSIKATIFAQEGSSLKTIFEAHLKEPLSSNPSLELQAQHYPVGKYLSYAQAAEVIIQSFRDQGWDIASLKAIGHRVVHGGERYVKSVLLTPDVNKDLEEFSCLAPLHNQPALETIRYMQHLFSQTPHIAVFDTAFHATLPPKAALYPIPWELSCLYKIKRYGFHGLAHAFSWKCYEKAFHHVQHRVITVHLGHGCSLAAICAGICLDTSMGFTPLDGIMMSTRSGELDPAIVAFLVEKEKKSAQDILDILNHQSGLLGVSGAIQDMQIIVQQAKENPRSKLALEMFIYQIQKKIGSYLAVLGGVDALLFSGGIGENSPEVRQGIAQAFSWYGIQVCEKKNQQCRALKPGNLELISLPESIPAVYVVASHENLLIAEEVLNFLSFS